MTQKVVYCVPALLAFHSTVWIGILNLSRKPVLGPHVLTWQVIVSHIAELIGVLNLSFQWLLRNDDNKRPNCSVSINSLLSMWAHDDKTS